MKGREGKGRREGEAVKGVDIGVKLKILEVIIDNYYCIYFWGSR